MELDDRKFKILEAVIRNYLQTGEPVGSRTISKDSDMALSSATIRNEMADLEEMGYIIQPHTSAGRIPTDKGYRLYVDSILKQKEHEISRLYQESKSHPSRLYQTPKSQYFCNTNMYCVKVRCIRYTPCVPGYVLRYSCSRHTGLPDIPP